MSNGAEAIADKFRKKYGRNAEDVLEAALTYINHQGSLEAWEEHLNMGAPANLWALFDAGSRPSIQKVDDYAPEGYTDADAAEAFVTDLEVGKPDAVEAAIEILTFHSEQSRGCVGLTLGSLAAETGWSTKSQLELLIHFINKSPCKDACMEFLAKQAKDEKVSPPPKRGDTVHVPEPDSTRDAWTAAFTGTVIGFRATPPGGGLVLIVGDATGDCFDIDAYRVEVERG